MENKLSHIDLMKLNVKEYGGEYGKVPTPKQKREVDIDVDNVELSVHEYKNEKVICFRGSDDWVDWLQNFNAFFKDKMFQFKIARGQFEDFNKVKYILNSEILIGSKNITITGHSKGGALAQIAYIYYSNTYKSLFDSLRTVTFGSPKIMTEKNIEYTRGYDIVNYINGSDIVTKVPPDFMGYIRIGKTINIGKQKIFPTTTDHYPMAYLESLKKYKEVK